MLCWLFPVWHFIFECHAAFLKTNCSYLVKYVKMIYLFLLILKVYLEAYHHGRTTISLLDEQ